MLLFFYFESGKDVLIWVILAAVIFAVAALITKAAFVIRNNKNIKKIKTAVKIFLSGTTLSTWKVNIPTTAV